MLDGHAIEARIYAEDPQHGFHPTGGTVLSLMHPSGQGVRVDSALIEGLVVSSDYDPMLAKVIAWAPDRAGALKRLRAALNDTVTLGVTNNVEFLTLLLADPDVVAGALDTELIERHLDGFAFRGPDGDVFAAAALIMHARGFPGPDAGPWQRQTGWRLGGAAASVYRLATKPHGAHTPVQVLGTPDDALVTVDGGEPTRASVSITGASARVRFGDSTVTQRFTHDGDRLYLASGGASFTITDVPYERKSAGVAGANPELRSPMPGTVVAIFVKDGTEVEAGTPVLSIEAMKMEHVLRASVTGTVVLQVLPGAQVSADQVVASIVTVRDASAVDEAS